MAEYRITVEGSEATASIPDEPGAQAKAAQIARGFCVAYPGRLVSVETRGGAHARWHREHRYRGEEETVVTPRRLR